jgi:hypothetical protein
MIRLTEERQTVPCVWVDPDEESETVGWRVFCHEVRVDSIRPYRRLAARGLVGEPGVCRPAVVARRAASRVTRRGEGVGASRFNHDTPWSC